MKKTFNPNPELIRAAQAMFTAMAHHDLIKDKVTDYERAVLVEMQAPINPEFAEIHRSGLPEIILDPRHSYLMAPERFPEFDTKRQQAMRAAGFTPKQPFDCPRLEAEALQTEAACALMYLMAPHIGLSDELARKHGWYRGDKGVELTLKLLAPFVGNAHDALKAMGVEPPAPKLPA